MIFCSVLECSESCLWKASLKLVFYLQVKVVCQFKGREMDFKDLAFKLFQKFIDDIGEVHAQEPL